MILDTSRIQNEDLYREELQFRCETNHWFLADLVGYRRFNRDIHARVFDELYFPKNKKLPIEEQHPIKKRMHIDPRFSFKSTAGIVDSLQWMLAFPSEISILNESATQPLAAAINEVLANFFWAGKLRPKTVLQLIYPQLTVEKRPGPIWDLPVRPLGIDTTLAYTSPGSQQAGWHPWILNPDDMAETTNSGIHAKPEVRQNVIDTANTNEKALQPGGYMNLRGTRYHPLDLYGDKLEKMDPKEWKCVIRSAVTVKNGARLMPGEFPLESELVMNFAGIPGLSYKELRSKFMEDYESFMSQLQNDPQGGHVPTFDEKVYAASQADLDRIPPIGDTLMCWRLPYAGKPYMTHAEGAVVRIANDRVYVLAAWRGTYPPSGIAERMVKAAIEHEIEAVILEDLPGSEYMAAHIRNEALKKNRMLRIQWLDFEEDDNRRAGQIGQLEPFMKAGRLIFASDMNHAAHCRRQFVLYGLVQENGIIDCIAKLAQRVPMSLMRANMSEEEIEAQLRLKERAQFDQIFGPQGVPELEEKKRQRAQASMMAMERLNQYGLPPLPGGLDG